MNKKELIEELNKSNTDHDEIRISYPAYQLPPEVGHDIDRIYQRVLDYDKLLEELMRDWMGVTYNILSTKVENIREAVADLRETINLATGDNTEVVADTVTLTNRRAESGAHYKAIVIGE